VPLGRPGARAGARCRLVRLWCGRPLCRYPEQRTAALGVGERQSFDGSLRLVISE